MEPPPNRARHVLKDLSLFLHTAKPPVAVECWSGRLQHTWGTVKMGDLKKK